MVRETGAGPRGERSMAIETDHGEVGDLSLYIYIIVVKISSNHILALYVTMNQVKSKYRYMGFGLWENTDPTAPKPIKKPSPPPPPPKVMTLKKKKN